MQNLRKRIHDSHRLVDRVAGSLLTGLLFSAITCSLVWAQTTAQVSGNVKDQSGAVLPGAEVSVTQTDTGLNRTAVTDETGSYSLPNLPIGPYRLEAALPGFRPMSRPESCSRSARIPNQVFWKSVRFLIKSRFKRTLPWSKRGARASVK